MNKRTEEQKNKADAEELSLNKVKFEHNTWARSWHMTLPNGKVYRISERAMKFLDLPKGILDFARAVLKSGAESDKIEEKPAVAFYAVLLDYYIRSMLNEDEAVGNEFQILADKPAQTNKDYLSLIWNDHIRVTKLSPTLTGSTLIESITAVPLPRKPNRIRKVWIARLKFWVIRKITFHNGDTYFGLLEARGPFPSEESALEAVVFDAYNIEGISH